MSWFRWQGIRAQEIGVRSLGREDPAGEGDGNPLQYPRLGNATDRGARWAAVHGSYQSWAQPTTTNRSTSKDHTQVCVCGDAAPEREESQEEAKTKTDGDKGDRRPERGNGETPERGDQRTPARDRGAEPPRPGSEQRPVDGPPTRPVGEGAQPPVGRDSVAQRNEDIVGDEATDSLSVDSLQKDTMVYTAKQLRRRAKAAARAERDSVRAIKQAVKDSLNAIEQARNDSIQKIKDSILQIKIDTIIAERIARSSRLADEEAARIERIKQKAEQRRRQKIDKAKARALKRGREYKGEDYIIEDTVAADTILPEVLDSLGADSERDTLSIDSLVADSIERKPIIPADSAYKMIKAYRRVKMFRSDSQMICDSLVTLNTDSIVRMYIDPIMWNETNQISADSSWIYTHRQKITKAHFMGAPVMGTQIDTACYNQVKGKDMTAYFEDGEVYRYDVDGNAQTLYYMQEQDAPDVTALMYIESSAISFHLDEGQMDHIVFKQNPEYVLYPMNMIPDTQERILQGFVWSDTLCPTRTQICDRHIRGSRRMSVSNIRKPTFPIAERIDYDRRRLVENRMWKDRNDRLTPDVIEWRNACPSYKNRRK